MIDSNNLRSRWQAALIWLKRLLGRDGARVPMPPRSNALRAAIDQVPVEQAAPPASTRVAMPADGTGSLDPAQYQRRRTVPPKLRNEVSS
jgi:hypothetical protein